MKTRAWDGKHFRDDHFIDANGYVYQSWCLNSGHFTLSRVDWKLSRFTGLLDKNMEEIYEFDIIKVNARFDTAIGVVEWVDTSFQFKIDVKIGYPYRELGTGWYGVEVLGNVFQNPKLLEVK